MTPFEIIILVLIYYFCYGYALKMLEIDNKSWLTIIIGAVASVIVAFDVPMIIGVQIAEKLKD